MKAKHPEHRDCRLLCPLLGPRGQRNTSHVKHSSPEGMSESVPQRSADVSEKRRRTTLKDLRCANAGCTHLPSTSLIGLPHQPCKVGPAFSHVQNEDSGDEKVKLPARVTQVVSDTVRARIRSAQQGRRNLRFGRF